MTFERTEQSSPGARHTGSAQEYEWQRQAAEEIDAELEADDAWLDRALKETFPASDPIPIRHHDVPPPLQDSGR
jgi:hypothetical protein